MKSVLENDKQLIEKGKLLNQAINNNIDSFNPDFFFKQMVSNYSMTEKIIGKSLIKLISGYDPNYVKKNINIPEFQRELKEKIIGNIDYLKDKDLIDIDGSISNQGLKLASLILYVEELDHLIPKGILGEKVNKKDFSYGIKEDIKNYKKGDRYRDIAIKKSIKLSLRRSHNDLQNKDIKTFERQSKGQINVIYAIDASGSMKGDKIETCKKAGIALAYKAINDKDKVGLIVFGSDIKEELKPTDNFMELLSKIASIRASRETNLALTIKKSIELFPLGELTKHLLLITDAMPTKGIDPEKDTLQAASEARNHGITISLIGIRLEPKTQKFAEKIVDIGNGRLYVAKNLENLDLIVLEDYNLLG